MKGKRNINLRLLKAIKKEARREEIDAHTRPTGRVQVCRNLKKYDRARAKDLARRYRNEL
ncbi:MAG: hypothetical protein II371_02155 [Flavobacteriales bacterium]|nr:hypothetical protein [Flavobacteriales bacterium]MBQ1968378.1 hypothetical protein [Flavobacteriales bacterium]MBQ5815669.1 hypothetical protein [Flavobacteriales bacterium]